VRELPPRLKQFHEELSRSIPCIPTTADARRELETKPLRDLLAIYINWQSRFIPPRPRIVQVVPDFWNSPLVKRHTGRLRVLIRKIEAGDDLSMHLSNRAHTHGYVSSKQRRIWSDDRDFTLNGWEVQHVHLDEMNKQGRRPHTLDRELLYAVFGAEEATLVLVGDHNSFDDGTLDDALVRARAVSGGFELVGIHPGTSTARERVSLARRAINSAAGIDGKTIISSVLSASGTAVRTRVQADEVFEVLYHLDPQLESSEFALSLAEGWRPPKEPVFEWKMVCCALVLTERKSGVGLPLVNDPRGLAMSDMALLGE